MQPVQFMVTTAGLDALVNAQGGSTEPIKIASVGLTETAFLMAPTIIALPNEMKRITALSGAAVSETIIHMTAQDSSEDVYELRGLGLYLDDGTLFAIYSQASPLFRKVSIAFFLMALDVAFQNGAAGDIIFGDATFLFPPATETVKGVVEIATPAEVAARTDHERFVTPRTMGLELAKERTETDADLTALSEGFDALLAALIARTITGDGLVTGGGDLSASRVLSVLAASFADVVAGTATDRAVTPSALQHRLGLERAETDEDLAALTARTVTGEGLLTGGGDLSASRVLSVLAASFADVVAGTATDRAITPSALQHRLGLERAETDEDLAGLSSTLNDLLAALIARTVTGDGLVTGGGDLSASRVLTVLAASFADVVAGTATDRAVTPSALQHRLGLERDETDGDLANLSSTLNDLLAALVARTVTGEGLVTGGGDLSASRVLTVLAASFADVVAGTATDRAVTPSALQHRLGLERDETDGDLAGLSSTLNDLLAALIARTVTGEGLVTGGGDLSASRVLSVTAATSEEIMAGLSNALAVTPAGLSNLPKYLGQDGYAVWPGGQGLKIKWGRFTAFSNTTSSVTFPIAFDSACLSIASGFGTSGGADSQDNPPVIVDSSISRFGFSVFSADDSSAPIRYIAIGI